MSTFDCADLTQDELILLKDIRKKKSILVEEIEHIRSELAQINAEIEALDIVDDDRTGQPRHRAQNLGRKKFNLKPKQGIEFLVDQGLLDYCPESIAEFLFKGEGLSKKSIGEYLGERNDFNIEVLQKFVELHNFKNLILVQALRQFLWSFMLPGEAQKIDRMMECFAKTYCKQNPGVFRNHDTCYILSFSLIMLNTSLHNPSVKEKTTSEQFVNMNRGIDNGNDLSTDLLQSLYENIASEKFRIPDDGSELMHTFFNPDRQGWLQKLGAAKGSVMRTWQKRWFIISDSCLYYFEQTTDKEPRGIIPLENVRVRSVVDKQKPHTFEIYSVAPDDDFIKACKTDAEGKVIKGKHKEYRLAADCAEEKESWMKSIEAATQHSPLYDALTLQKERMKIK